MRATYFAAMVATLWGASAAAQELDLSGYHGFVRVESTQTFQDSSSFETPRASRETRAQVSEVEVSHFRITDGQATGTYRRQMSSQQDERLTEDGLCLSSGGPSHVVHLIREVEQGSATASGPAECSVVLDEFGGGIDCWAERPFTYVKNNRRDSILNSDCADLPPGSESTQSRDEQENDGFGASHYLETPQADRRPTVLSGTETRVEFDGSRTTINFYLSRDDAEYELLLVPQEGYATWRPKAGASETERGNTLVVRATLRRKDGQPLDTTARRVSFRLALRSHEPGVMMNHPAAALRVSPTPADLAFEQALNDPYELDVSDDGAEAVTREGSYETVYVQVSSYDWGAFGALVAEAELFNGERVAGRVEGASGADANLLLIPRRASIDDPIAEGWRGQGALRDGDALSDEDDSPAGDGHDGDGLSLYDEYRGFMVNGARLEGNPERKELFIHNTYGTAAAPGIARFARESELRVHAQLRASELSKDRVVNFNTTGRFSTPQRALRISPAPPGQTWANASGGPGTPGQIGGVYLPLSMVLVAPASYLASTLAHELGHGVNIYHHGESDLGARAFQVVDEVVYERRGDQAPGAAGQLPVSLFYEDGTPFPLEAIVPTQPTVVGVRQGQHSGVQECMMRYDTARWHVRGVSTERFLNSTPEVVGTTLCTATSGTGVNASDHSPAPRYGGAADHRGNCKAQLCLNDRHFHPRR